jgi:phage FluMu protein Com
MKCRCAQCKKTFATEAKFQAHACIKAAMEKSLDELMAEYEARRK